MIESGVNGAKALFDSVNACVKSHNHECDDYDYVLAQTVYEDAVAVDMALSNIRMILLSTDAALKGIDREDVAKRNGALESALSSIYNILLTPEGKPK